MSAPQLESMKTIFFDLDKTILSINSGLHWVGSEWRVGQISGWQLLRALWWITRYQLGEAAMEEPLRYGISLLRGQEEREMEERVERFFERVVGRVRPRALEVIAEHQARGERCVLITASSIYIARRFADHLGLDDLIATRFEVSEGRFTGAPDGPLCFGAGKRRLAESYLTSTGLSLSECWLYTDSYSDLPLLEAVGSPQVVTPDPKLKRAALRRGWPIHDW